MTMRAAVVGDKHVDVVTYAVALPCKPGKKPTLRDMRKALKVIHRFAKANNLDANEVEVLPSSLSNTTWRIVARFTVLREPEVQTEWQKVHG